MAPMSNATRKAVIFVVLMVMASTLSSSFCYARTIADGANPPLYCFYVEKCKDRCQIACSLSFKSSTGPYCKHNQCCCA
ncbi:hypothetical protein TRIUR3_31866 [Triticum urartu]|uniref:Uncharacterized protein n=1 Tax=Triticum urartu TaxID=4572 RepID=M8AKW9_TRIUA|nr:hypothetical protein TRIUR3_31866 [Triticum urartu]